MHNGLNRRGRWLLSALLAAITACGGGGGGTTSTAPSGTGVATGSNSPPSTGTLALVAGNADGAGNVDGTGIAARFNGPSAGAVDRSGNLIVLDSTNGLIRKIAPNGQVSTVFSYASTGLSLPSGLCFDPDGNLYVSQEGWHSIMRITPAGASGVYAGNHGTPGTADGVGAAAGFNFPRGIACDNAGNVYVADSSSHTVRKIAPGAVVSTLAGSPMLMGSADGTGTQARFMSPSGVAVDANGTVWVADSFNHSIRKITTAGVVSTFAGLAGTSGYVNGNGSAARFSVPMSIAVDTAGAVYVQDQMNAALRKVTPAADVSTLISGGTAGLRFSVAAGAANVAYAISTDYHAIYKVDGSTVSVLAGKPGRAAHLDATGGQALFDGPQGVVVAADGSLRVVDGGGTVRAVSAEGVVTTVAGSSVYSGYADGVGIDARFSNPRGAAIDAGGNVYVADSTGHTIRKMSPGGTVTTLAGLAGTEGSADGAGTAARFSYPQGVAVDASGNVYVADSGNHAIRKITPAGAVTTLAGNPAALPGFTDGTGSAARFSAPSSLALDRAGVLYVTDDSYSTVRKVTPSGDVVTFAGAATTAGSVDGLGTAARFSGPKGLAADADGNIYVADTGNHTLRRISATGTVTTVAGVASKASFEPGPLPGKLSSPRGLAVKGQQIYITMQNGVVRVDMAP